jgi:hypothetical protein
MRSLAVIVFIAVVGGTAIYFAQRPTVARGSVLAGQLVESSKKQHLPVTAMECTPEVPIGMNGGDFECDVHFMNGDVVHYTFHMDRDAKIQPMKRGEAQSAPRIKKTSDPWGD